MTTSVVQAANAARNAGDSNAQYAILASIQADIAALATALAHITTQMDANTLAGHPYSVAAANPVAHTLP